MLKPSVIQSLPALPGPILTVYLDTDQAKQINRGLKPGYLIWLESQATSIAQTISPDDQQRFRKFVEQADSYLQRRPPACRSVMIFAGNNTWEFIPLRVSVENEVHWGRPALAQLLWLLDEHKRYGIAVPGRKRVRFFLYWLGEARELEGEEFRLEPSKEKEMGPVARPGVRLSRGTNRDVFEHHLAAAYAHYYQKIAERIVHWYAAEQLESVFLVGLAEQVKAIRKEIPSSLAEKTILIEEYLGWVSRAALLARVEPAIGEYKQKCEMTTVEGMLTDSRNAVLGVDEALAQLQQGKVRSIVVMKALSGILHQCVNCSWVDRSANPVCPSCGGKRESVELRDALPELVRRYNAPLEVVSGDAARKLQEAGGMGAWLREFEKKEYAASA